MGRECTYDSKFDAGEGHIDNFMVNWMQQGGVEVVPHLRALSSITEEEARNVYEISAGSRWDENDGSALDIYWNSTDEWYTQIKNMEIGKPAVWLKLLEFGFDLFGLIEAGLAKEVAQ